MSEKRYEIMPVVHIDCQHPVLTEIGDPVAWMPDGERSVRPCAICEVEKLKNDLAILHPDAVVGLTQEVIEERLELLQACSRRYRELLEAFRVKCPTCRCRILPGHECVCCADGDID